MCLLLCQFLHFYLLYLLGIARAILNKIASHVEDHVLRSEAAALLTFKSLKKL